MADRHLGLVQFTDGNMSFELLLVTRCRK